MKELEIREGYFPQLTGIRAIAAFMVYIHHFNPFAERYFGKFTHDFFGKFHIGVTIFFVLSGFLISYRYLDNYKFEKAWFINYIQNRAARIYPVYFLLTTLTFIVQYINGDLGIVKTLILFGSNITFIRGFFDELKFTGIAQGWSLTVEETFYFLAPIIFLFSKKFRIYWQPAFLILIGILIVCIFQNFDFFGFFKDFRFMFLYTFFGRAFEFFCGIFLTLYLKKNKNLKNHFSSGIQKTSFGIIGIMVCIIGFILVKREAEFGIFQPLRIFINNIILPVFIALLFGGLIYENSWVKNILQSSLFEWLGKSSYIFYLIHLGIFHSALTSIFKSNSALNYILIFILLNIISLLIYKFIEHPLNRIIRSINFLKSNTATR